MEIRILASGSKGNIVSVITDNNHLLIDVGISYSRIKNKLMEHDLKPDSVKHVIITHEHRDHTSGLRVFLNNNDNVKIHLTKGTLDGIDEATKEVIKNYSFITPEASFNIGNVSIYPLSVSHDANEPVGLIIQSNGKKAVFITDTGYIHKDYFPLLKDADFYYLESNHDEVMLMESRFRPHSLKMRVLGERGHLSNNDATRVLNQVITNDNMPIWAVAHISEDCNTQEKIEEAIVKNFDHPFKAQIVYTSQENSEVIKLWK